jgi:hypothetical protein
MMSRKLIRLAWVLLAFNGVITFAGTLYYTWQLSAMPSPRLAQGFNEAAISPNLYLGANAVFQSVIFFTYLVVAFLVFWRLPDDRMALFTGVFLVGFGAASAYPAAPEFLAVWESGHPVYVTSFMINNLLGWPLLVAFLALYPDGRFTPRWMVWAAVYGFLISMGWAFFPQAFGEPTGWFAVFVFGSVVFVFGSSLYAQVYRFRFHSTEVQRQQTKWMVYGFAFTVVAIITQQIIAFALLPANNLSPGMSIWRDLLGSGANIFLAAIPIAVGIAILRYRLYDIDLVIRRTLAYGALTGMLALIYYSGVVVLQSGASALASQNNSPAATVVTTLVIAALFNPLRRRIQDFIDRRFYRQKYNAEQALAAFAATASRETDLAQLSTELVGVAAETMQPERSVLWLVRR